MAQPFNISVPPMAGMGRDAPIPVGAGDAGMMPGSMNPSAPMMPMVGGGAFSPEPPTEYTPDTHNIGIPDVSDQTLMQYGQIAPEPNEALMHARIDRIWLQVAKEYKILTGDKKHDHMLWEDHQLFMQDAIDEDPISHDEGARDEFLKRVMEMMGGE